jgi:ABC-2 type transport system ATP-binding protein
MNLGSYEKGKQTMITVTNLTKRYGPTLAVDNISFEVKGGEILGFLGPNGAGKSTTMKILTCYMPPDEGKATLDDLDTLEDSLKIREKIGYLPENTPLYHDMGVVDYLKFVAEVRKIPRNMRKKRIKETAHLCGLDKELGKNIGQLSKGFRQRVGLAQTLIHNPDILILDEPTTGLDPNQIVEMRSLIKEIGREKTVILCSHILPEVQATCNRIIIIKEGKIVGSGTPDELAARAQGGEEIVYISINGPQDKIQEQLEAMENVRSCRLLDSEAGDTANDGGHRFEVKSQSGVDIRESLFHLVVRNQWSLTELQRMHITLEDVFKQLTVDVDVDH